MVKESLVITFVIFLFLSIFIKEGFAETNDIAITDESLAKIEPELLSAQGETSVIISFTKKPQDYKKFIKILGGKITHDYKMMDAISVKLDSKEIKRLSTMGNLKRIYKDYNVSALLHDSAPLISADKVWNMGITGKNVKVCILDSGVDYNHPALEKNCKNQIVEGTNESYILQSPHDYPDNYDNTWTITKPGYTSISVHFTKIITEEGFDFVYVKDAQGNIVESFSGEFSQKWSISIPGDTIKINLVSDSSTTDYGFYIDQVLNGSVASGWNGCNKIIGGYDFVNSDEDPFDDDGHGTHVTGILASDDSYYRGVANGTKLLIAKVLDSQGSGSASNVISGIEWCVNNNAQILSMSLGGSNFNRTCDDTPISQAVINAVNNGKIVVAASGNDGIKGISEPACSSKAIAVGASDKNKKVIGISGRGSELDVLAIGTPVKSTWPGGGWYWNTGTSMAVPHITGTIALMLEKNSSLSFQDVLRIFNQTSDPPIACYDCIWINGVCDILHMYGVQVPCIRNITGAGIVNASRAIENIQSGCVSNEDCNDNNNCTTDICQSGSCTHTNKPDGTDCGTCCSCFSGNRAHNETQNSDCLFCQKCTALDTCSYAPSGTDPKNECRTNDIIGIATCDNIPDNYHLTRDFRNPFTSTCNGAGSCTTGNATINHICNRTCGAECGNNSDCASNICRSDCTCLIDSTPLLINILYPLNTTYISSNIPLTFTLNKPASWCGYSLDGSANKTITSCANITMSISISGPHNVIVYANDTNGKSNSSNRVYFTKAVSGGGGGGGGRCYMM